jgi:hypothetical protein
VWRRPVISKGALESSHCFRGRGNAPGLGVIGVRVQGARLVGQNVLMGPLCLRKRYVRPRTGGRRGASRVCSRRSGASGRGMGTRARSGQRPRLSPRTGLNGGTDGRAGEQMGARLARRGAARPGAARRGEAPLGVAAGRSGRPPCGVERSGVALRRSARAGWRLAVLPAVGYDRDDRDLGLGWGVGGLGWGLGGAGVRWGGRGVGSLESSPQRPIAP